MFKLVLLCVVLYLGITQNAQLCPSDSGLVSTSRLTFTSGGNTANTIPAEQTLTYNHTFNQLFNGQPGVIVSIFEVI